MSSLICPKCEKGNMKWVTDIDSEDLLENGIMQCQYCKEQFVGMPGWMKEMSYSKKAKNNKP